jgi:23S rRNA pseudouridine2457 synthase
MPPRQHYILLHKPYGVVCQFSPSADHPTLASCGAFPKDVYPVGRLDTDSEGLVLLTNDRTIVHRLLEPRYAHPRSYLAQVEGIPGPETLARLRQGVRIGLHHTRPAEATLLDHEPDIPPRSTPIRYRKNIPTSWIVLVLREGKNRQVRRMTAAVGYPTLRLIRVAIGALTIQGLAPGEWRPLTDTEVLALRRAAAAP